MRRLASLATAAAAALLVGNAHAAVFVIDDFNGPDQNVADTNCVFIPGPACGNTDGIGVLSAVGAATPNGIQRQIYHELNAGGINTGGLATGVVVGSATFPAGAFEAFNNPGRDSTAAIVWSIPAGFLPDSSNGPASLNFDLLFSDLGVSFKLFYDGVLFTSQSFPQYDGLAGFPPAVAQPVSFGLTAAQQDAISVGTGTQLLQLVIEGNTAWDLTLERVSFIVPAPGTLALAGLALMGAGLASRRRKAA